MISYNELQKTIFDFSYGAALGDAIGQKAFEGNKKPLRNNEDAKNIAQTYIDAILEGKNPDFYETAKALEKSFETYIKNNRNAIKYIKKDGQPSNPVFRFGNAQKLMNMLAKNMFLLVYQNQPLRENFKQCHCPMDNEMIKAVKSELEQACDEEARNLLAEYKKSKKSAWSRIEKENIMQYENFQKCVLFLASQKGISPIEYDYWMWKQTSLSDDDLL